MATAVCALVAAAPGAAQAAPDWPGYGRDLANTRSQADFGSITRWSAPKLTEAWANRNAGLVDGRPGMNGNSQFVTATPAVSGGVAYWGDYTGTVRAVDVATGAARWTVKTSNADNIYLRQINSSPAVSGGKVYVANGSGEVVALNQANGSVAWRTTVEDEPFGILYASPVVADGKVLIGTSSVQNAATPPPWTFRGRMVALDANNGNRLWQTYTQRKEDREGAGGAIWGTAAVDTDTDTVYFGSGNAYEAPAGPRTDALIAVDLNTGAEKWKRQFTAGDVFNYFYGIFGRDYDLGGSPNLFTINGRKAVGVGDKGGSYVTFDAQSGQTIWRRQLCRGSHLGGIMTTATVARGAIYVTCNTMKSAYELADPGNRTDVYRLQAANGIRLWKRTVPGGTAGALTEAGGAVFVPNTLGTVTAYNALTGAPVWQTRPGGADTRMDNGVAGGVTVAENRVLVGYGYIFDFRGAKPDSAGGVVAYKTP